jgi:hypothetical protein
VGRDRADEVLERVEGAPSEQAKQADQQDHGRQEGEQGAEGDLLREPHAVVGEKPLAGPFEDVEPLGPPQS